MCALACWVMLGCQTNHSHHLIRRSQPLLGTFVVITAYGADREATSAAATAAFDEIRRVDSLMSLHRADSELARVNATAAQRPLRVSPDLFVVLSNALEIARHTGGSFDPTIAPLTQLWGFLWKEHRLPSPAEIEPVLSRVNYELVEVNAEGRTVRFKTNGVTLDLNAIAKGYAVDCALEKLRAFGVTNAMVRAGGDLRVAGAPPGRRSWAVQIEDPARRGERRTLSLRNAAVSTSGSYENFFEAGGRRYSHILNPRTGMPIEGIASCTVIAPTCMQSDAWATGLFVLGPDAAMARFGHRIPMLFGLWGAGDNVRWRQSSSFGDLR
jgi:FAD:protein FMN transferase